MTAYALPMAYILLRVYALGLLTVALYMHFACVLCSYLDCSCARADCQATATGGQYTTDLANRQGAELRALYTSLHGDSWLNNSNWLQNNNYCTWQGMGCCGSDYTIREASVTYSLSDWGVSPVAGCCCPILGAIVSLRLPLNNVSGSVFTLSFVALGETLLHLDLQDNNITGSILPSVSQLKNLRTLVLSGNRLTGTIPVETANMSRLAVIILDRNQLQGSVPKALTALSNLTVFTAKSNQLTGWPAIPLLQTQALQILDLSKNQLSGSLDADGNPFADVADLCEWQASPQQTDVHIHLSRNAIFDLVVCS